MNNIKCYIIDDQAHGIKLISDYIIQTPYLDLVGSSLDPIAGLEFIRSAKEKIDILFVDVDMPTLNGMELSALLGDSVITIFVTAHARYAVDSYNSDAVDFLLKPVSYARFLKSVEKAKDKLAPKAEPGKDVKDYFFVTGDRKGKSVKIIKEEVVYIEAIEKYVKIHLTGKTTVVTLFMISEFEAAVRYDSYQRIHKSYIVNMDHIRSRDNSALFMDNGDTVYVGKTYKDTFDKLYDQLLIRSGKNANK